jgi:hypothetical protein
MKRLTLDSAFPGFRTYAIHRQLQATGLKRWQEIRDIVIIRTRKYPIADILFGYDF